MTNVAVTQLRFVMKSIGSADGAEARREIAFQPSLAATLYRVVCYTSLVFGVQGIARTLTAILLLGLRPDPVVLGLAFALPVFVYGHDRLRDPGAAESARVRWAAQHRRAVQVLVGAAGVASVVLAVARPRAVPLLVAMMVFALTYTVRWLPGRRSPKQLPGFKTPYVAAIWTALTVALPMTAAGAPWNLRAALVATAMFLILAPYSIVNDTYDVADDERTGTRSLPVLFGERGARLASCLLSCAGAVAAIGLQSPGLALAGLYSALYAAYAESRRGPDHTPTVAVYRASSVVMALLVRFVG